MYIVLPSCERVRSIGSEVVALGGDGEIDHVVDLEGRALGLEPEAWTVPLPHSAQKATAAVFLGPGVFLVDEASAGGAAAVFGHPGEDAVGAVVVVVRIAVIAAVDVVGDAGPPAVAVVGVVVGEEVVEGVEVGLEVVAGAGGEDFELRGRRAGSGACRRP